MDLQAADTTTYSLSSATPGAPADRRDGQRTMTLYRVGSLSIGDRRELCLIRNISAGGMMVRTYCEIEAGTALTVELKCGQPISGVVSWARDAHVGVSFDQQIDVIDILTNSIHGPRPRIPRIEVSAPVTVREGASVYRMRVLDVSQGGIKVRSETCFAVGSDVVVTLAGVDPQPGVVRWTSDDQMGITFNRMIALPILVEWLRVQRG